MNVINDCLWLENIYELDTIFASRKLQLGGKYSYRKTHTVTLWNVQQICVWRVIWKYFCKGDADVDEIEGPFSSPNEVGYINEWCWKNVCWAITHCFFQWFLICGGSWVPFLDPYLALTFLWLIIKSLFLFLHC